MTDEGWTRRLPAPVRNAGRSLRDVRAALPVAWGAGRWSSWARALGLGDYLSAVNLSRARLARGDFWGAREVLLRSEPPPGDAELTLEQRLTTLLVYSRTGLDPGRPFLEALSSDLRRRQNDVAGRWTGSGLVRLGDRSTPQRVTTLFVSGAARSGTTALGRLLNASPRVALFVERYEPDFGYHPDMFTADAVFCPGWEQGLHAASWGMLQRRVGQVRYIGDKMPNFLLSWHITRHNFRPRTIRILHIIRNIYDVAHSFNQRAQNSEDRWSQRRDFKSACAEWNLNNLMILEVLKDPKFSRQVSVVQYEKLFTDRDAMMTVFSTLNIGRPKPVLRRMESEMKRGVKVGAKVRTLSEEQKDYISRVADFNLEEEVRSNCILGRA